MTNYYISQILCKKAEVCSEPIQLSLMERFPKIVIVSQKASS